MVISFPGFSGLYPVVTSISAYYSLDRQDYYFTQKLIDIGPAADAILPANRGIEFVLKATSDGVNYIAMVQGPEYPGDGVKTVGEVAIEAYNYESLSSNLVRHNGPVYPGEPVCLGYASIASNNHPWSEAQLPGGCFNVPPPDEFCKITTPEIVLDHGTISLQEAEGSVATGNLGVQCTSDVSVTFNLVTQDKYIYLDEGKSEITVDDRPLNTKLDLKKGDSQLPIKDLLTGVTSEGFHTGSSVLVLEPY